MQYREFVDGIKISALGYGCMRFQTENDSIIEDKAIAQLRYAIDHGVNYLDTAYVYHHGTSETLLAKALTDGYREKVYIADKMPVWMVNSPEDFDKIFETQLERLNTDRIDFYLLHALDREEFEGRVKKFDLMEKMRRLKRDGKVGYIGFSFHDTNAAFHEIVDGFEGCDFCQIQYNYVNTDYQAGTEGLEYAASKGLKVIIMEPLLGSALANLDENVKAALPEGSDPVQLALDFLWSRPEVGLVLSGMTYQEHLEANLRFADESRIGKLPESELAALKRAKAIREANMLVPCTGCAYCMPCPGGLEIPRIFRIYNSTASKTPRSDPRQAYESLSVKADSCLSCGNCEELCPQHIDIRQKLKDCAKHFE